MFGFSGLPSPNMTIYAEYINFYGIILKSLREKILDKSFIINWFCHRYYLRFFYSPFYFLLISIISKTLS